MVLGVNTADDRTIALDYMAENKVTFPNVLDSSMEATMAMARYETLGMRAVPLTYVIDREGKVVDAWYDYEEGRAEKVMKKLIP